MKTFLKKIKLIENFSTELQIEKHDFVKSFRRHVDESSSGLIKDLLDAFSSSKNEFKGSVGINAFRIKRRKRFFDSSLPLVAEGTYRQRGESLLIDAEISGASKMMISFCVFLLLFYLVALGSIIMKDDQDLRVAAVTVPFLFIHAAFMFGIPYFMMRRSIKRMKHDLERELYYLTKPHPKESV